MPPAFHRPDETACPSCGGRNTDRLISRFARLRGDDELAESLADPSKLGDLNDPAQMLNWMKSLGREMGEDLGDGFDQMLDEAESEDYECSEASEVTG